VGKPKENGDEDGDPYAEKPDGKTDNGGDPVISRIDGDTEESFFVPFAVCRYGVGYEILVATDRHR
jgi:hypothetical protein